MMRELLLLFALLLSSLYGKAQYSVTGHVSSAEDRIPLAGVFVKTVNATVVTNENGYFLIETFTDSITLEVSLLGYQSMKIVAQLPLESPLLIHLEPNFEFLEEVVVSTGYQDIPRARVTGSFAHISNKRLNEQVSPDIISRLEAIANSLSVDRKTGVNTEKLMIRGLSTFLGPSEPLIILDNFPYHGSISNINPNDVQNITILKDAAAASIWGARAGNGVIVITTKQGQYDQPLMIEFNSNIMMTEKPDLSYFRQINSSDFIDLEMFLYDQGYYESRIHSRNHDPLSPVIELLLRRDEGLISAGEATMEINRLRDFDVRDDFSKYMYQEAVNQQYYLSLRGGARSFSWIFSGGYDKNVGSLGADYDRISLRFQNTIKPLPSVTLSGGLYYILSKTKSGRPGYGMRASAMHIPPYTKFADEKGQPLAVVQDYSFWYLQTVDEELLDWYYYPLEDYKYSVNTTNIQNIIANFGLQYEIADGFAASIKYRYERQRGSGRLLNKKESYFARSMINSFTQIDPDTREVIYNVPPGGILDLSNELLQGHNLRGQLTFNRTSSKHDVAIIAGSELQQSGTESGKSRFYGFNQDIYSSDLVDYVNRYPHYVTGRNAYITNNDGFGSNLYRFVSFFGNAAYTFKEKYTASLSGRRDASNIFGVNTNDKWRPLWSAGLAWRISKEEFYKWKDVPYVKLRMSYGYSGNIDLNRSAVLTTSASSVSRYTRAPRLRIRNYPNPELRWEKIRTINVGLDFETRSGYLRGSMELWQKSGTDLYGEVPMDYTAIPTFSYTKNVASMKAHGMDLELNTRNLTGAVRWQTHFNLSYYRDKVTDYYLESQEANLFVSGIGIAGIEGKPVNALFAYKWAGLDPQTGDPRGYVNGEVSKDYDNITGSSTLVTDLEYVGPGLPTFYGSIGNTFDWKNFSVTFRLTYKLGYYFRRTALDYVSLFNTGEGHNDYGKRWQQPGDELHTTVPSMVYPAVSRRRSFYQGAAVNFLPADHLRFDYISLNYRLPFLRNILSSVHQLDVYANIQNIGIVWRKNNEGLDPERSTPLLQATSLALGVRARL